MIKEKYIIPLLLSHQIRGINNNDDAHKLGVSKKKTTDME